MKVFFEASEKCRHILIPGCMRLVSVRELKKHASVNITQNSTQNKTQKLKLAADRCTVVPSSNLNYFPQDGAIIEVKHGDYGNE